MNQGRARGLSIPGIKSRDAYKVNRPDMQEGIWQPLYDFQTYAAAGQTELNFFQTPQGQSGKTLADTNMESAGQLPQPKFFLLTSLMIAFFPGSSPVSVQGAAPTGSQWNDAYTFNKSGFLELFIGSKTYLNDAPLGKFPPDFRLAGAAAAADASTAAVDQVTMVDYAVAAGPVYSIVPVLLEPNQNFKVSLKWPSAVALPSTVDARVGVIMGGYLYRLSQ